MYALGGKVKELCTVEGDNVRINDAKCDAIGRVWFGTMGLESSPGTVTPKQGNLYSYDGGILLLVLYLIIYPSSECYTACVWY